ncbi:MAG: hypothetical protein ACK4FF_10310 [Limnobacter sp.]|uniref:hypothetical protein n=1 Tax=Limnobacter sp. TaxID=2003368 RepID=UPI00391B71CD
MKSMSFHGLSFFLLLFLMASCAINMDHHPDAMLRVWRDSPEDAESMRLELTSNGFKLEKVSNRMQVLYNDRGCKFNLFFNEEKRLTSYQRLSDKEVCVYSVGVKLSPQ